jgi:hypothetical protein
MTMIICGRDCENCVHSEIDDKNIARIKVFCAAKDKSFWYGQCIPCEDKQIRRNIINEDTD